MEKPPSTYQITVQASTEHLAEVRDFIRSHAAYFGFSKEKTADICLAVDEAYTNIIKHAYKSNRSKSVDIKLGYEDATFWVTLMDTGNAFDPTHYQKPDIHRRIKQKKRGGVGVYLIKQLMDEVEYLTEDDTNSIRMIKKK